MDESILVLRKSYERGITLYDTANLYLDSEEKIGRALEGLRHQVILATKTFKRDRQGAEADLNQSLRMLRTDYIDLYQLHQVSEESDYEALSGPNGAMEAVLQAQKAGKIRHIGVTSHKLKMAVRLARTGLFSTIQFPFNFLEPDALEELHPLARQQGMGILAMKPFAGGAVENAQLCFKFLRQWPDVIPLAGFDAEDKVDEVVDLYAVENTVSTEDLAAMEQVRQEIGKRFCRRCQYCLPCPQGVTINTAMIYPIIAHRMSPAKAAGFAAKAMESVRNCIECGECVERCPYDLPIPEMISEHLDMYDKHLEMHRE
jgi:predicted aldo/keto reductase-like oxidoreductase